MGLGWRMKKSRPGSASASLAAKGAQKVQSGLPEDAKRRCAALLRGRYFGTPDRGLPASDKPRPAQRSPGRSSISTSPARPSTSTRRQRSPPQSAKRELNSPDLLFGNVSTLGTAGGGPRSTEEGRAKMPDERSFRRRRRIGGSFRRRWCRQRVTGWRRRLRRSPPALRGCTAILRGRYMKYRAWHSTQSHRTIRTAPAPL